MGGFVPLLEEDLFRVQQNISCCQAQNRKHIFPAEKWHFPFIIWGFVPLTEEDLFQVQPRNLAAKSLVTSSHPPLILSHRVGGGFVLIYFKDLIHRFISTICFNLFQEFVSIYFKDLFQFISSIRFEKSCCHDPSYFTPSLKESWNYPSNPISFFKTWDLICQTNNKSRNIKPECFLSSLCWSSFPEPTGFTHPQRKPHCHIWDMLAIFCGICINTFHHSFYFSITIRVSFFERSIKQVWLKYLLRPSRRDYK